uniref:Ribokinase n=1 Tax=Roseihalotalea indica TaxID=2867963 RepID=A0AA49JIH0_9BACT|nr:ribokinase [Tunicatimonas sp. TK19036]
MNQSIVVIGSSNIDMIAQVSHFPKPGETVGNAQYSQAYGGKGANQAVAAARAGGGVTFITSVGHDLFGQTMLQNFINEGINTDYIVQQRQTPSGTALILVNEAGENCIAVAPGANAELSSQLIDEARIAISGAEIILLQLEIPVETVSYVADLASSLGKKVMLNPAPAQALDDSLLKKLHFLVLNETEAELLVGHPVQNQQQVAEAAQQLLQKRIETVIITLGARGAYFATRREQQMVPAYRVQPVDTTGAGDVFCGALATALSKGQKLATAVQFANAAAGLATTKLGAQPSAPTEDAVKALIKEYAFQQEVDF